MKTLYTFILITVCAANVAFAQNEMKARMEFEDAEIAYTKGEYNDAVKHLENAENLLGKPTSKIRYLLVLSLYNNLSKGYEYKDLEKLRKLSSHYLDSYTTATDKYREIYGLFKVLNEDYPKSLTEYNKLKQEEEDKILLLQEEKQRSEKQKAEQLKHAQDYVLALAQKYNFKPNLTLSQFMDLSMENEKIGMKLEKKIRKTQQDIVRTDILNKKGPCHISIYANKVAFFGYAISCCETYKESEQKFELFKKEVYAKISAEYLSSNENKDIIIRVPGTDMIVQVLIHISDSSNTGLQYYFIC